MLTFDAKATRDALPFPLLIDSLRTMFLSPCEVPRRHVHGIASTSGAGVTSLIMPAWNDRYYGVKIVNVAPGNAAIGLPGLHSSYLLHDAATGVPLALVDGDEITARRTAAASALAATWLARDDARHLLVVGAGKVARLLPDAYRAVRAIDRVTAGSLGRAGRSPGSEVARRRRRCTGSERAGKRRRTGRHRELRNPGDRAGDPGPVVAAR